MVMLRLHQPMLVLVPSNFGTSNLYIFNSGTHEAVIQVNLKEDYKINMEDLKEKLRKCYRCRFPGLKIII